MQYINDWKISLTHELIQFIDEEYQTKQIAPRKEDIFKALQLTSLSQTKVVIFGQDPYPTLGVANGLAFSATDAVPKSLVNLFKELESDLNIKRDNPDLSDWAKQGILLLNTCLTVEVGKAGSHSSCGWKQVVLSIIEQINNKEDVVIFVLLGNNAKKLNKYIDAKHIVLEFTHPSPLSAYRGFFGCKMFSQINRALAANKYETIKF